MTTYTINVADKSFYASQPTKFLAGAIGGAYGAYWAGRVLREPYQTVLAITVLSSLLFGVLASQSLDSSVEAIAVENKGLVSKEIQEMRAQDRVNMIAFITLETQSMIGSFVATSLALCAKFV